MIYFYRDMPRFSQRYQILTFLVAGHETTSGALSFTLYYLARNPAALRRAQEETDEILAPDRNAEPTYDQVARFRYIRRCLDEAFDRNLLRVIIAADEVIRREGRPTR